MEKLFGKVFPEHFCRSRQLPGTRHRPCQAWAGRAWGWEPRELRVVAGRDGGVCRDGGAASPNSGCLFSRTSQDRSLAVEVAEVAALGSPKEKLGDGKDLGREQGLSGCGARRWPGGELGRCLQFQSPVRVCKHSVRPMFVCVPVNLWGSRSTVGPSRNHEQLWRCLTTPGQVSLS